MRAEGHERRSLGRGRLEGGGGNGHLDVELRKMGAERIEEAGGEGDSRLESPVEEGRGDCHIQERL